MITTTTTVTSKDGTTIGCHRLGDGPGLVIVHGMMQAGDSQLELAQALSGDFTCHLPARRGRGGSGPHGQDGVLGQELDDLDALLTATRAPYVMGVSAGAIIALRAARARPGLRKVVVFEPPLDIDGANPTGWLPRFDQEIAAGRVPAALVTAMLGARLGPPIFNVLPRAFLELLTGRMLKRDPAFGELAPTLRHDVRLVAETAGDLEAYRGVEAEVLLLGGSRSPAHLRSPLAALERVLPRARRVELRGLGHSATCNADRRGRPDRVAEEVRRFLL
ncbi:alpha/beta hydrolase [Nonomuraea sp. NPDC050643]|uniref:alpha/beta fold hydrolase n=1 Tax=Nonomuraea sp. NPDC050643 TaxID=3155660 RepID=UPI0033E62C93